MQAWLKTRGPAWVSDQCRGDLTAGLSHAGGGGTMSRACLRMKLLSCLQRTTFGGGRLLPYLPLQVGLLAEHDMSQVLLNLRHGNACIIDGAGWGSAMHLECCSFCNMTIHALVAPTCRAQRISSAAPSATRQCIAGAYLQSTTCLKRCSLCNMAMHAQRTALLSSAGVCRKHELGLQISKLVIKTSDFEMRPKYSPKYP